MSCGRDSSRDWNLLFSNEALCRVHDDGDRYKRAPGVPCMYSAIMNPAVVNYVNELRMPPSALIGYLKSIGWCGRREFVERLSIVYNQRKVESGG